MLVWLSTKGDSMHSLIKTSAVLATALLLLSACDTTKGFGEDVSKGGNDISHAAQKNTPEPSSTGN
jgi:predicted small secreted protein